MKKEEIMDMSDIGRRSPTAAAPRNAAAVSSDLDPARWHALVSQIGAEVAAPLTTALERINTLTSTGRIDRQSLRALRDEVEAARQVGMIGQQLTRFATGRLRQSHERLQLANVLGGILAHRSRETQARGINLKPALRPVDVIVDASLLFGLLNATLDWAIANARSQIEFSIEHKPGTSSARLLCRFVPETHDGADNDDANPLPSTSGLDSLTWRLVEQTAWTMGLGVDRRAEGGIAALAIDFPRLGAQEIEGVSAIELDDGFAPSTNSQPLAGSHVLVIASRRDMRVQVRDALRNMSLIIDFVNTVDDAINFCREGLPHAIVIESVQKGERFAAFREEIMAEVPGFVFIEIIEEGSAFEMSGFGGTGVARVGRDVIASSLPSALLFELSRSL